VGRLAGSEEDVPAADDFCLFKIARDHYRTKIKNRSHIYGKLLAVGDTEHERSAIFALKEEQNDSQIFFVNVLKQLNGMP